MKRVRVAARLVMIGFVGLPGFAQGGEPEKTKSEVRETITVVADAVKVEPQVPGTVNIEEVPASIRLETQPQFQFYDMAGKVFGISTPGEINDSGLELQMVDGAVRSQLGLQEGQGLSVASVAPGSPAAQVGLASNDLLLTLDGKPLAKPSDLSEQLKAAGEKDVTLRILRAGKTIQLQARPVLKVTLGAVPSDAQNFFIGVTSEPVDATLRSQLNLESDGGLVVRTVEPESPAAKAGLKTFDIMVSISDQNLKDREALVAKIQDSKGKAMPVKILREGKVQTLEITPVPRPNVTANVRFTLNRQPPVIRMIRPTETNPANSFVTGSLLRSATQANLANDKQLADVVKELHELRQVVEKLQKALDKKETPEK
ncbi:PDZ domain-containing protein [Singulisphaera sp. PoT]|uniref:PDZ domain-containing protein n=1 Tax=Singulisphaera sp. PoT TaxID=3411797 RepID=UPI003BF534DD